MESRVNRLEIHFDYLRRDLDEIKTDVKAIVSSVSEIPTRKDLSHWQGQWVAIGLTILATTIGGIIGGLALIASSTH